MEKREPSCSVGGNVNGYSHYGRWYGDSLKSRNKTTIWPSNPIPTHIPWGNQIERDTCIPLFIAALFAIARTWTWLKRLSSSSNSRTWKQPRCPLTDEWIKKLWYIYTMEYYSAIEGNVFEPVLVRWTNLEPVIQSEVSQKEKDKYHILTHIYRI